MRTILTFALFAALGIAALASFEDPRERREMRQPGTTTQDSGTVQSFEDGVPPPPSFP